jgi:hypothetical protein
MPPIRLTGPERGELATILIDAFNPNQFRQLLTYRLNRNLDRLAGLGGDYDSIMFQVLEKAAAQWWIGDLLVAAHEENPRDPFIVEFASRYGVVPALPAGATLEHVIHATNSFLDVAMWRSRLGELEGCICRIEVPIAGGTVFGTGFLAGPQTVVTNYHVVERVIKKEVAPATVVLRFDYKVVGGEINPGRVYGLASGDGWLIDSSPYSEADLHAYTPAASPSEGELDYAVLRVAERIGALPIGDGTPDALKRGWVKIPDPPIVPASGATIHILQHPNGEPMKLALGERAIIGLNTNGTRVRYSTNTLGGSSGSPGFDENWNLLALHHAGDPRFPQFSRPEYNQGIPINAIVQRLRRNAKFAALQE